MRQASETITIETGGKGFVEFTDRLREFVAASGIDTGLLTAFCRHTSASLLITENAAGAVKRDLAAWLERVAPEGPDYEHDCEGPDDMPSHIRAMLTDVSLSIPIVDGMLALGTWQGIFLCEHRRRGHTRSVLVTVVPAAG